MRGKGLAYLVSDVADNELPVLMTDSLDEVAAFFGMNKESLLPMISRGARIRWRYRVERVDLNGPSGGPEGDENGF